MSEKVNLWDSKSVEVFIIKADWTNGYKNNVFNAYADWCKYKGFEYSPQKYPKEHRRPYIPREKDLDQLIAGCGRKLAC